MSLPRLFRHAACWAALAALAAATARGQYVYEPEGGEYAIAGSLPGDQVQPAVAVRAGGGLGLLVWADNLTDGDGQGVSARTLDSTFSGLYGRFGVNTTTVSHQEKPQAVTLRNGGAATVWQGGPASRQHVYAGFLRADGQWAAQEVRVNAGTNFFQSNPDLASLANSNVVVTWESMHQESADSMKGVYARVLSPLGDPLAGEFAVNQFTAYNQRNPSVAALADGGFVIVWVSELQRAADSVDVYARRFTAAGAAAGPEFRVSTSTNLCATPRVAAGSDGGFVVVWAERELASLRSNSWDIVARPYSAAGVGGPPVKVNAHTFGDQFTPRLAALGTDYLVAWTSLGQDGSREGVYARFLRQDASPLSGEFRVNSTLVSQQLQPVLAADGVGRFLIVWSGFRNVDQGFELYGQRYARTLLPLETPGAPGVSALNSSRLMVAWAWVEGLGVTHYEVYANGSPTPTALVTNRNTWTLTGLAPNSTHTFRIAYVVSDGRRSPLSPLASGTTWGVDDEGPAGSPWFGGPDGLPDDWQGRYFGANPALWPSPFADSDGDGVSNRDEFLAGTDPTRADSVLRMRTDATPTGVYLRWSTVAGCAYQLWSSGDLRDWTAVDLPRFAAGDQDAIYVGGAPARYYRVQRFR